MILLLVLLLPLVGAVLSWLAQRHSAAAVRWTAVIFLLLDLPPVLWLLRDGGSGMWRQEYTHPWIPSLGIGFHLAVDGLSVALILLTLLLGLLAVVASWREINERIGFFHFNILAVVAGLIGVFSAIDLFLFYFCWELMLIPMYFLISIWGHEHRRYAALKFFIFTQAGGLVMLLAIFALVFAHGGQSGHYTFDYPALLGTSLPPAGAMLIMLGFFVGFAVKLPMVPLHTWLPDAHTEAPTGGSILLAGVLLKSGAYGMLRFVVPLFPDAARRAAPWLVALAVAGILYGAVMAFAQKDLKRLVAFSSVSHLGFVLLGIFSWNETARQGAVLQMICHGISTGALFFLVGAMMERTHTRDLDRLGGLQQTQPRLAGMLTVFALASLGLPGFGNFVAEFLVLAGVFPSSPIAAAVASLGLVYAAVYSLWIVQRACHGGAVTPVSATDLSLREMSAALALALAIVWIGIHPRPVMRLAAPARDVAHSVQAPERSQPVSMPHGFREARP